MIPEKKLEHLVGAIVCRDLTGWMLVTKSCFGDTAEFVLDICPGVRLSCLVELNDPLSRPTFRISMDMGFRFETHYLKDVHLCRGDIEFKGDSTDITICTSGQDICDIARRLLSEDPRPLMDSGRGTVPLIYGGFIAERTGPAEVPPWNVDGLSKAIRFAYLGDRDVVPEFMKGVCIGQGLVLESYECLPEFEDKSGWLLVSYEEDDVGFWFSAEVDPTSESLDLFSECCHMSIPVEPDHVRLLVEAHGHGIVWTPDYLSDHPCRDYRKASIKLPEIPFDLEEPDLDRIDLIWGWAYEDDD